MKSFKIGHYTNLKQGTGCTVILCCDGTKASASVRGAAPGTRETALLSPYRKMEEIHAVLLTGGSAFGLDSAAGVVKYLAERGKGYQTPFRKIPIVPAAVVYDLYTIDPHASPGAENAYQACETAQAALNVQGNVGAGTGATVGKWAGLEYMMKGGLGIADICFKEVWIRALAVANPVGDIVSHDGTIIAGARQENKFLAQENPSVRWNPAKIGFGENTVLVVIMTNAKLNKLQLFLLADRSHYGIARSVIPSHTSFDGDVIFALGTGDKPEEIDTLTEMAIEATSQAIINGVITAGTLGQIPGLK